MEYYPSGFDMEMQKFFSKRKTALERIRKIGLSMPYISDKLTYDQLVLEHAVLDLSHAETDYLKDGIISLVECLKKVSETPEMTEEEAYEVAYNKHKEYADRFLNTKNHNDIVEWLKEKADFELKNDPKSKKTTEEVLIREIAEFKTRLGRVNVTVDIKGDALKFNDKKKMEQLVIYTREIIENPREDIFVNADAFILFRELHSIYKDTDNPLADYSFIYRQMAEKDKLIKETFKPEKFRDWINSEPYNADVNTKFKTYDKCFTKEKYNFYQYVKSKQ